MPNLKMNLWPTLKIIKAFLITSSTDKSLYSSVVYRNTWKLNWTTSIFHIYNVHDKRFIPLEDNLPGI